MVWMRSVLAVVVVSCATATTQPVPAPAHDDLPVTGNDATAAVTGTATVTATVTVAATATVTATATVADWVPTLTNPEGWPPALLGRLAREADAKRAGVVALAPPPDVERDAAIQRVFGHRCKLERTCGPLWGVDCAAAVDGPYYYARPRADRMERITVCGGACMGGRCTNCPPRDAGWTCPTY